VANNLGADLDQLPAQARQGPRGEVRLDPGKTARFSASAQSIGSFDRILRPHCGITVGKHTQKSDSGLTTTGNPENVGGFRSLLGLGRKEWEP
jgi:hypothetical protein